MRRDERAGTFVATPLDELPERTSCRNRGLGGGAVRASVEEPLMNTVSRTRAAFTLVELLVVIAIIGVLVALLLPAVQTARESARRGSCTNNLRQLGLGLHLHHDIYSRFPAGTVWEPGAGGNQKGSEATWLTHTLPYIEQDALYKTGDFNQGFGQGTAG